MSTKEHSLLVEKYRSKNLTEYVGKNISLLVERIIDPK